MRIKIKKDLTAARCSKLKASLLDALERDSDVELDLSAVPEIDSCGIQLLLSLQQELRRRGGALRIVEKSVPVNNLMNLYGLNN